jgi:cell division transport system ATP-binding protein
MGAGIAKAAAAELAVVRLEHIAKRYGAGAEILHDISVALEPGGFYFLTGASGAGKSTLLKIICLAEPPTQGVLRLFDTDAGKLDRTGRAALRRRIGIVFQDIRLIDDLSVAENVALPLRIAGPAQQEIREHVVALLGWLGLEEYIDSSPTGLSGSERQRVAMARAIVSRPDLLVADEPTGHVDDEIALLLVRVLERMNSLGTTVLVATHDRGFASRFEHPRFHLEQGMLRTVEAGVQ